MLIACPNCGTPTTRQLCTGCANPVVIATSPCGNMICDQLGCQGRCTQAPSLSPMVQPPPMQFWPHIQRGCICRATAEQTCQRSDCGRRSPNPSDGG